MRLSPRPLHVFSTSTVAAAVLALTSLESAAAPFRGMLDHSLCCGAPPPGFNQDGSFDPAPDPLLRRHRSAPPPTAPAAGVAQAPPPAIGSEAGGTPALPPEPLPPLKLPTAKIEDHLDVGFETLGGFPFKLTKEQQKAIGENDRAATEALVAQIPDLIRQLDGKKVLLTGFMLPMKLENGLTTEFLLVANSMLCCYGVVPPMNQWVVVKMKKGGLKPLQDVPLQVFGTLRVKPQIENGMLSTIYTLDGDRQHVAKK